MNPTVGCVIVKNKSVISSGVTSVSGRPHAEYNALKLKKNFKNADLYVTMEPCTHIGLTPPCSNFIKKKKIKRVFYSFNDIDERTAKKFRIKLNGKKVQVFKKIPSYYKSFYESYFHVKNGKYPYLDAKIAVSKDYFTVNRYSKWITNEYSRSRAHLIRSEYDAILSTSKSINIDNSMLNCRIEGFNNSKPDLIIIDLNLKIKKNLDIFKKYNKRKIFIVAKPLKNKKINYLKKKGIKFIFITSLKTKEDFNNLLNILRKISYNRILVECGLIFLNQLLKKKLIQNLYLFKSQKKLGKKGKNNTTNKLIKSFKLKNEVKVNLDNDNLFKVKIK